LFSLEVQKFQHQRYDGNHENALSGFEIRTNKPDNEIHNIRDIVNKAFRIDSHVVNATHISLVNV